MTTETKQRTPPAPVINPESQPYWDAAQQKKLMFKHCKACNKNHFYPRTICPFCFSDQTEWKEASGKGTLYTHSTMRRGAPVSYTLAYVTLAEGPKMLTNIYDCDNTKLKIDQPMKLVFKAAEDGKLVPGWTAA
jgi:hypothetical protein